MIESHWKLKQWIYLGIYLALVAVIQLARGHLNWVGTAKILPA